MSQHQIVYSIGVRFAGGGIGNIAYHNVLSLYRHGMLRRLLCGSFRETAIPNRCIRSLGALSRLLRKIAIYDPRSRVTYLHNRLYDQWARRNLEHCSAFLTWNGFGLDAMRRAKELNATTIVYRASAHIAEQMTILEQEYARWNKEFSPFMVSVRRSIAELKEADYILIPSAFVRESFIRQGFDESRLIEIPFGVDTQRFHPSAAPLSDTPFRVLFVGQVGFQKGVPYLLEAWRKLNWKEAELWLVGRVQSDFHSQLQEYRDLPGLRLMGHVGKVASIYRKCHLFVFPSLQEGSALVVYEAMASALPVVTTPHAGSLIRHGKDGYLVEIRNSEKLAEQMEALRGDQELRHEIGNAARERIEPFTWERYGNSLALVLSEKLDSTNRRRS